MYPPGNKSANHRKGYCADGAPAVYKGPGLPGGQEAPANLFLPEWPQPQGIFKTGSAFDPPKFLLAVRDLYEKIADHEARDLNPAIPYEYTLEDMAFSKMLRSRTEIIDEHTYFRLYDLTLSSGSAYESLVLNMVFDGHPGRYLCIDCL